MNILFSCIITFICIILIIHFIKPIAIRIGLVATPSDRKKHAGKIPLIGGLAAFLGLSIGIITSHVPLDHYRSLFFALAILVFVGVLDDFHEISHWVRFLAQIIAALIIVAWGEVVLHNLGNLLFFGDIKLHLLEVPFTVLAVVGVVNAINMIDGVDGLAGTLVLIELISLSFLAYFSGKIIDLSLLLLLISAVFAFLCFNFPLPHRKASIFMGDVGSMFLGLCLAWFLISFSQDSSLVATPVTFLWIMALPLFDLLNVVYKRIRVGKSPFHADREHFHYVLHALGIKSLSIVIIMGFISIIFTVIGIAGYILKVHQSIMFVAFLLCFMSYVYLINHSRLLNIFKKKGKLGGK